MCSTGCWQTVYDHHLADHHLPWAYATLHDMAALGRVPGDGCPSGADEKEQGMNIIAQASVSPLGKLALEPPIQQAKARLQAAGLQMRSKEQLGSELMEWVEEHEGSASRELMSLARMLRKPEYYQGLLGARRY
jgi:hypothetical protein